MLKIVIATIIVAIVVLLAIILIRFNRKRLHIIRCAEAASERQLEAIYAHIDHLGTETPSCAVLAQTNRRSGSDADWSIPVPSYVEPWGGRSISAENGSDVTFRFVSSKAFEPIVRGRAYRLLPVPRHLTKSGKARNQFSPGKYVASIPSYCLRWPRFVLRIPPNSWHTCLRQGLKRSSSIRCFRRGWEGVRRGFRTQSFLSARSARNA